MWIVRERTSSRLVFTMAGRNARWADANRITAVAQPIVYNWPYQFWRFGVSFEGAIQTPV